MTPLRSALLALLVVWMAAAPAWALLGADEAKVAKLLGEPVREMPPVEQTTKAALYEKGNYEFYVAYDAEGKAVYVRVTRKHGDMSVNESLSLVESMEPKEKWSAAGMDDPNVWAWENANKMMRAEFDRRPETLFLMDLAWQDVVAGRPPRKPTQSTAGVKKDVQLGNQKLTREQAQMLERMMPSSLPRAESGTAPSTGNGNARSNGTGE